MQRERMVCRTASRRVVVRTMWQPDGGSSSVFKKAFAASGWSRSASWITATLLAPRSGFIWIACSRSRIWLMRIRRDFDSGATWWRSGWDKTSFALEPKTSAANSAASHFFPAPGGPLNKQAWARRPDLRASRRRSKALSLASAIRAECREYRPWRRSYFPRRLSGPACAAAEESPRWRPSRTSHSIAERCSFASRRHSGSRWRFPVG